MTFYAGDEYAGDEITSGVDAYDEEHEYNCSCWQCVTDPRDDPTCES